MVKNPPQASHVFAEVRALLKEPKPWADPGHVVTSLQIPVRLPFQQQQQQQQQQDALPVPGLVQKLMERQGIAVVDSSEREGPKVEEVRENVVCGAPSVAAAGCRACAWPCAKADGETGHCCGGL